MSVINQMLKDLEARQRRGAAAGAMPAALERSSRDDGRAPAWRWAVFALAAVAILAAGVWGGLHFGPSPADAPEPALAAAPAPSGRAVAPDPVAAEVPVTSTGPVVENRPVERPGPPRSTPAVVDDPPPEPSSAPPPTPEASAAVIPRPDATLPAAATTAAPVEAPAARQRIDRLPPPGDPLDEVRRLLAEGDASGALARLDDGAPANPDARALRATALQSLGRHREATTEWSAALERQPDVAPWWVGLGISLEAEGRTREALAAYAQAERRGPLEPALADYVRGRVDALSATTPR